MPGIDLHAHTTASDGSLTPTQLVQLARDTGLNALAVTDHDTLAGLDEARGAGSDRGVEVINGIELAVEHAGRFHLLGYGFDPGNAALNDRLVYIQEYRANRNHKMVDRMRDIGLDVTWEDVAAESGGDLIARPHMALAMVRKGIVETTQEAFDCYLQDGGPCHVPKIKMTDEEAIGLLQQAGGLPVVAHPLTLKLGNGDALEVEVKRLKEIGLRGLEVFYPQHTADDIEKLSGIADRLGLVKTGGSDFHGTPKPKVFPGSILDGDALPYTVLENLKAALEAGQAAH